MKLSLKKITVVFVVIAQGCASLMVISGPVNLGWNRNESHFVKSMTPLMEAISKRDLVAVEKLLEQKNIGINDIYHDQTPLMMALTPHFRNREQDLVKLPPIAKAVLGYDYKHRPIDINAQSSQGVCVLMHAAQLGNLDVVNMILNYGQVVVDPHHKNKWMATPLVAAIQSGKLPVLEAILEYSKKNAGKSYAKIDINYKDGQGCSPVLWAVLGQNVLMVQLLLKNGADLDPQKKYPMYYQGEMTLLDGLQKSLTDTKKTLKSLQEMVTFLETYKK